MGNQAYIENFSVTDSFADELKEYYKLVEKYPLFKKSLKTIDEKYLKKGKTRKLKSVKIRFAIAFTKMKIKEELEGYKKNGENKQTTTTQTVNPSSEKKDI